MSWRSQRSTLFPYTTLFRSMPCPMPRTLREGRGNERASTETIAVHTLSAAIVSDRKSTRLNSSHVKISYAVSGLKNKNWDQARHPRAARYDGDIGTVFDAAT